MNNSLCLDVYGAGNTDETNVHVYSKNNTNAQKWKLTRVDNTPSIVKLAAPSKVTVTWEDQAAMKAKVFWPAVSGATSYEVEYNHITDAWRTEPDYTSVTSTSFISTGVGHTSYNYRVRAVNSYGKSDWTVGTFAANCKHSAGYKTIRSEDGNYVAVCKNCGKTYEIPSLDRSAAGQYQATGDVSLCKNPYQDSKTDSKLKKDETVKIVGSVINAYGNLWYKTDTGYWVYSDYLALTKQGDDLDFAYTNTYQQGQFKDVPTAQWFTASVAGAYSLGLMKGSSENTFNPYGDVTLAEAITMACRINSIYTTGSENFTQSGGKWYQAYLDYALDNGIIGSGYYTANVEVKATRAQFAEIFAKALPDKALYPQNNVTDNAIPDVRMSESYAPYVYKLYRAGILSGGDAMGTFSPGTYITRAEAATIVTRMAQSSSRQSFSLN